MLKKLKTQEPKLPSATHLIQLLPVDITILIDEDVTHDGPPPVLPAEAGVPPVDGVLDLEPLEAVLEGAGHARAVEVGQSVALRRLRVVLLELRHQQRARHVERDHPRYRQPHRRLILVMYTYGYILIVVF